MSKRLFGYFRPVTPDDLRLIAEQGGLVHIELPWRIYRTPRYTGPMARRRSARGRRWAISRARFPA